MSVDLAPTIDAYLSKRGSPMAGTGVSFVRAGARYGIDPRLLVGIATIESGAGQHLSAAYNPFNWSIHQGRGYQSWEQGIMDVARGLKQGYISKGLTTPQQIVGKYAPSADGNNEANWSKVVSDTIRLLGGTVSAGAVPPSPSGAAPPSPLSPLSQTPTPPQQVFNQAQMGQGILSQFATGGRANLASIPGIVHNAITLAQSPLKAADTQTLQQNGVVSPGGDLQDPAAANSNSIVRAASTQIGKPYVFGSGPDTSSFDCSDLIQWSYAQAGIKLPRTTFDQVKMGRAVDMNKEPLRPGDLVFPSPHHVVMYVGDGKVIAAPHTGTVVQYQPLANFGKLYAVRRVLG